MNLKSINDIYSTPDIKLEPKPVSTSDAVQNRLFARRVKVLKYIKEHSKVKTADIEKDLNVVLTTLINDIEALVNANAVVKRYPGTKDMTIEYCIRYYGIYCVL